MKPSQRVPADVSKITQGSRKRPTIKEIPVDQLKVDPRVQRALMPSWVKELTETLDLDALSVLTVSERSPGDFFVLDGQHRLEALKYHDMGEWEVTCHVYRGLSLAQEAAMFRRNNKQKQIKPYDDYTKGLVEGDPICVGIERILARNGLVMKPSSSDGAISCVVKIKQLYELDEGKLLDDALGTCIAAWGARATAVEKPMVGGMAIVLKTFGQEIDRANLAKKLTRSAGGASGVLGKARALKDLSSDPVDKLVARVMVAIYNQGRRGGRLDETV